MESIRLELMEIDVILWVDFSSFNQLELEVSCPTILTVQSKLEVIKDVQPYSTIIFFIIQYTVDTVARVLLHN